MSCRVSCFQTIRRRTHEVRAGRLGIGGGNPIRVQSMTTTDTRDIAATVAQCIALADAGCELIRITAPNLPAARCLREIRRKFSAAAARFAAIPLAADIHFLPAAAMEAVEHVEKVRINPGNYADRKKSPPQDRTDADYDRELQRLHEAFTPLVLRAKTLGRALRIGTNHGSLSDRIMHRHGDTPLGMVESALEFLRIAESHAFDQIVLSMKSSNPKVMIQACRLLVARMAEEGMRHPLHLGVTEAGDGEDGRIKSAIGIGSLLADGLGDTLRVSLTEDPVNEIPVAKKLIALAAPAAAAGAANAGAAARRETQTIALGTRRTGLRPVPDRPSACPTNGTGSTGDGSNAGGSDGDGIGNGGGSDGSTADGAAADGVCDGARETIFAGGKNPPRVLLTRAQHEELFAAASKTISPDTPAEGIYENLAIRELDPRDPAQIAAANALPAPALLAVRDGIPLHPLAAHRLLAARADPRHPILLKDTLDPPAAKTAATATAAGAATAAAAAAAAADDDDDADGAETTLLAAAINLGALLCDGIGDAVLLRAAPDPARALRLAYDILQGARARVSKTEYIACPGCGRTLFDLQAATRRIRARTGHLKGVTIAIMGCIVNGPGEMAGADFGYVGGAPGKINLYAGKTCVHYNIPQAEADARLIALIKQHGQWRDPPVEKQTVPGANECGRSEYGGSHGKRCGRAMRVNDANEPRSGSI